MAVTIDNKQTTWGANNLVIIKDYNSQFNEVVVGNPEVTLEKPTTAGGSPTITVATWYKLQCEETAQWKYVGMDYTTAKDCENALLTDLTFNIPVWEYGAYISNGQVLYGYHTGNVAPQLFSSVTIEKCGNCDMYNVIVNARVTSETYSKNSDLYSSLATYLKTYLNSLTGWSNYPSGWTGRQQTAASANNIVLIQAPTANRKFEIIGFDMMMATYDDWSGFTVPTWYKYTDTFTCQVQYTGMTRTACTNLFTSLNNDSTGWYYSTHPWQYVYDSSTHLFKWTQIQDVTTYQCLNDFRAIKSDGNMWIAELDLCVQKTNYIATTPIRAPSISFYWPTALWRRIPGLSQFL